MSEPVRGFMCKTGWAYELGHASDGNRIFPSEKTLRRYSKCVDTCGIVEVEVTLVRVVQEDKFDEMTGEGTAT